VKLTTDLICVFGAQVYGYNKYFFLIDENNIIIYFNIHILYNIVAANNSSVVILGQEMVEGHINFPGNFLS
jgi:hypothetical protein